MEINIYLSIITPIKKLRVAEGIEEKKTYTYDA